MSQEISNDLIDSVTAEIEAIIQEEIDSQNISGAADESTPTVEQEVVVSENKDEQPTLTDQDNAVLLAIADVNSGENIEKNYDREIAATEIAVDNEKIEDESKVSTEENIDSTVNTEKEDIVAEYLVQIGSPSQENFSAPEVVESLSAVPLLENIINDAPTDENDGPRAKHLKQALRKALNNTVKSCSGEKLESYFPFNLKGNQFSQINGTILTALKSVIDGVQIPFDEFLASENLVDKLNKVDEFTRSRVPGKSEASEAALIAALTPQNLIDRKLYATKLASLAKLEEFAQKLEAENSKLASDLNNRQTEFADRLDRLKNSQQLLDAALDQISTISMDDLEVLVDKMNHQYQPSALKLHN